MLSIIILLFKTTESANVVQSAIIQLYRTVNQSVHNDKALRIDNDTKGI